MALRIRGSEEKDGEIHLTRSCDSVDVWINGDLVACYYDSGVVEIHGKDNARIFKSRWDE